MGITLFASILLVGAQLTIAITIIIIDDRINSLNRFILTKDPLFLYCLINATSLISIITLYYSNKHKNTQVRIRDCGQYITMNNELEDVYGQTSSCGTNTESMCRAGH